MSCAAAHPVPPALASLENGMAYRLALIIAPRGAGKTHMLRQWSVWRTSSGYRPPYWASLTAQDNRLAQFLPHLASALAGLDTALDKRPHSAIQFAEPVGHIGSKAGLRPAQAFGNQNDAEGFLIDLINNLSEARVDFALILDEYHLIRAPEIHRAVDFLLEYLPPRMHMYLAARREPPLRLAQLRARRQMIEVGRSELQEG